MKINYNELGKILLIKTSIRRILNKRLDYLIPLLQKWEKENLLVWKFYIALA